MDCTFFLLLGCWISWTPVITLGGIALMPNTSLNCPGPIQFTCVGTDIPNTLIWRVRVTDIDHRGEYAFNPSHTFPRTILLNPSLPGIEVLVINVSISNQFRINIASTLTSTAMLLNGATIQCADGANVNSTVYRIDIIGPPTRPFLECSLVVSPGGVIVSFDSFSSGNNVTNYRVVLSPTTSSCPSEQLVSPSEDYSCSGLVLGTRYSFNVSAINCGNQEGAESTIIVHPQDPVIPEIEVFATYNENSLSQLTVTWQVKHLSISDVCSFDNSLNYSIFLEDGRGGRLEERTVNSDSCNNNLCSTSFNTSSTSNQSYLVSIHAVNAFGQSNIAESTSIGNLSLALTFKDCVTTLLCSSGLTEGSCVVQYGRDSSYENFENHLNVSLNSPSPLPLMDALTQYYFQVEVRVNSTFYRSRRSFMTGEFPVNLTDTNIGLLIIGILFLIGILTLIVWLTLFQKCDTASDKPIWIASLVILLSAVFLWLVSVCLWIAVGGVVGPQRNTCDSEWQSNRDNLIIAAFVLSFISLLLFITSAVAIYKTVHFKKKIRIETMQVELEEQGNAFDGSSRNYGILSLQGDSPGNECVAEQEMKKEKQKNEEQQRELEEKEQLQKLQEKKDLHNAAKEGNLEEVKRLIAKGVDPLSKNSYDDTAIHIAAINGKLEVIKYLTEDLHCDPSLPGWDGTTPLHSAAQRGYLSIVQYLMDKHIDKHSCDPNIPDDDNCTPLHLAAAYGHLSVVQHLTKNKDCNVEYQNKRKNTPLHSAAFGGHLTIVKHLVEQAHCPTNIKNNSNQTPLQRAQEEGQSEVVDYLRTL